MKKAPLFKAFLGVRPALRTGVLVVFFLAGLCGGLASGADLNPLIAQDTPYLVELYQYLHAHPELSRMEKETSARMAAELEQAGFKVTRNVGGYGVVGVLTNGEGPTVMLRTDMDALPVTEKTGLPYASQVRAKDADGREVGVMHACGHDVHMAVFIGAARLMSKLKGDWQGTLIMIAQPAEEILAGAKAMIEDGLFTRFPRPDYILGYHNMPMPIGLVGYRAGEFFAGESNVEVIVRGVGGHAARPNQTKDPIVLAAQMILAWQTIVSREVDPSEPAVVTVGAIHGGTISNVIGEEVKLNLTIRAYPDDLREAMIASVKRMAEGIAQAAGLPEDRMPLVTVRSDTPALSNDPTLTARVIEALKGQANRLELSRVTSSEDFAYYGQVEPKIPTMYYGFGVYEMNTFFKARKEGRILPGPHSPDYAPVPQPTIKSAVKITGTALLDLFKKD